MILDETARNHETLAWLDFSLKWAKAGGHTRLARLLEQVRAEVVFEVELAEAAAKPPRP